MTLAIFACHCYIQLVAKPGIKDKALKPKERIKLKNLSNTNTGKAVFVRMPMSVGKI